MRKLLAVCLACLIACSSVSFALAAKTPAPDATEESGAEPTKIPKPTKTPKPSATPKPTPMPTFDPADKRIAEVTTESGTLNVRKSMSTKAKVIAQVPNHAKLFVLGSIGDWSQVTFQDKTGFAQSKFLQELDEAEYAALVPGDKGEEILDIKRQLRKLNYLETDQVNTRYDAHMKQAVRKFQLLNALPLAEEITPEFQVLLFGGLAQKSVSGFSGADTDEASGLSAAIFCWASGGKLYEEDGAVKINIHFIAQAFGGTPPYKLSVTKTVGADDGAAYGDGVTSPFPFVWTQAHDYLYLWLVATDADGNSVTTKARLRYSMPERYADFEPTGSDDFDYDFEDF